MAESMNVSRKRTSQMHCIFFLSFFSSLFPVVLASASFSFSPFVLFHLIGKARRFFFLSFLVSFTPIAKGREGRFSVCFYISYFLAVPLLDWVVFERDH